MELGKASHCVYKIRYHVVFCLKYRKKLLLEKERMEFLKQILEEIGKRYSFFFETVGTDGDHVHILVGAAPRYSPSSIKQIVKSITAIRFFERFPEIKSKLWGGEFWSDGGFVGTVGEGINTEIIRNYIAKQGSKEEKEGFKQMRLINF